MTREDILVLLHGIAYAMYEAWAYGDISVGELTEEFNSLDDFDKDEVSLHAAVSWLTDGRDAFTDIRWSIDTVLSYLKENYKM